METRRITSRIGVDLTLLAQFTFTGIVTYARCVLPYLFNGMPEVKWILFLRSTQDSAVEWSRFKNVEICFPKSMKHEWLWKTVGLSWQSKRQELDLLFMPVSRAPLIKLCPVVSYIHDLGFQTQPQYLKHGTIAKTAFAIRHATQTSDMLLANSEFTKREICTTYKTDPNKIAVTYYGYDQRRFYPGQSTGEDSRGVLARYGIKKPFVLYLGVIQGRKNLVRLIEASKVWQMSRPDLQLVLAGKRGWNCDEIYQHASMCSSEQVRMPGPITDEDLATVYREAECYVLPSVYEGFGIPVSEAMACGTPVVLSRSAALPEAGGDAALYFDPYRPDEISNQILKVVGSPEVRRAMVCKGIEHVRSFTWDCCAERTIPVLRKILEKKGFMMPSRLSAAGGGRESEVMKNLL